MHRILLPTALALILLLQCLAFLGVPLLPIQDESAWYYMNVYFLQSKQYIFESRYPSFSGASQLFPTGGYSGFLFLMQKLQDVFEVEWSQLVRAVQFSLHLASAFFLHQIASVLRSRAIGAICALLYLLYFPFLNFALVVMPESFAIFLILLAIWLALESWKGAGTRAVYAAFFVASYSTLVKPVLVFCMPIMIVFFVKYNQPQGNPRRWVTALFWFMLPLLAQSLTNKELYGNFFIRKGMGWNLWDRVVFQDKGLPRQAPEFAALDSVFASHGERVPLDRWQSVAEKLSSWGFSEEATQSLCRQAAIAGIKSDPLGYFGRSLVWTGKLILQPHPVHSVYDSLQEYFSFLHSFYQKDRQHQPLGSELLKQSPLITQARARLVEIYYGFAEFYHRAFSLGIHLLLGTLYALCGYFCVRASVRGRVEKKDVLTFFVFLIPLLILLGSSMTELPQSRLSIIAYPLILLCAVISVDWMIRLSSKNYVFNLTAAAIGCYLLLHMLATAWGWQYVNVRRAAVEGLLKAEERAPWACRQSVLLRDSAPFEYLGAKKVVQEMMPQSCQGLLDQSGRRGRLAQAILIF